jgi:hypothetical protein
MIAVQPDQVYILSYIGGHCGEFICHWLSQHNEFVSAELKPGPNNGFHHFYGADVKFDPTAAPAKIIFPTHPDFTQGQPSKPANGIFVPESAHWITADSSTAYKKFYFVLYWIKTGLQKHPTATPAELAVFNKFSTGGRLQEPSIRLIQFFESLGNRNREWYYNYEVEHWYSAQAIPDFRAHIRNMYKIGGNPITTSPANEFAIDLDQLFFGNTAKEYERICDYFDIAPQSLEPLTQYHAKNVELVEHIVALPIDEFVALTHEQAWDRVYRALVALHRS